jgi:hypothetical protein
VERSVRGFVPTLLRSSFIVLVKEPPILKPENIVTFARSGIENSKNRSMITLHHRQIVNHSVRKNRAPFRVSKESIKTFISRDRAESFVSPGIRRAVITKIKETTIFNKTTEFRNSTIISGPRADLFTDMHNVI